MRASFTLSTYIARHFFLAILLALLGLVFVAVLGDTVETIRRASTRDAAGAGIILTLTGLKIPFFVQKLLPFAVLIGSMLALTRLTRTHELIVARAAGVSVWQFLLPALLVSAAIGVFMSVAFNPLAAAFTLRYEQLEERYLSTQTSLMAVSNSGLWLRQIESDGGEKLIHAERISQGDMSFSRVILFSFDTQKLFTERLDAERAVLEDGMLRLFDGVRSLPGKPPEPSRETALPTTLTLARIQDSFAAPETVSFWRLPAFIAMLEDAGFSALKHRLYWQSLLAAPFLLMGTVLVAAVFSLRLPRRGRVGLLVVAGVLTGFLLHFFTDLVYAMGAAGTLPVLLAGWAPALVMTMIGAAMLLHLEDG